jgi:hypothetical protein
MWISKTIWQLLAAQLAEKDAQLRRDKERIDRLVEALAQKNHVPLIMPQAELPKFESAPTLEKSAGWFDNKPIPPIPPSGVKPS